MQFDKPAPKAEAGDTFDQKSYIGSLLVIEVHRYIPDQVTKFSPNGTEAISADVSVISPDGTVAEEFHNALLFGKVLCGQLRPKEGRTVLGILGLGEAGTGKKAPYVLDEAPPAAEEAAVRAMMARPAAAEQPAQQQPAAAAASPWGQQPAQQQPAAVAASPWGQQPATAGAVPAPPWG